MAPFGQINACGGDAGDHILCSSPKAFKNLSEGHPMFVICDLYFAISRTSQALLGSGLPGPGGYQGCVKVLKKPTHP
jgi:hypothetical protein